MCLQAVSIRNIIRLYYLITVFKSFSFLPRVCRTSEIVGGNVQNLCKEGFETHLKLLLKRYKTIHTTKLLHQVKLCDLIISVEDDSYQDLLLTSPPHENMFLKTSQKNHNKTHIYLSQAQIDDMHLAVTVIKQSNQLKSKQCQKS